MLRVIAMLGVLVTALMSEAAVAPSAAAIFYVAPDGDDCWSGRFPAPDGRGDGPFATVVRARDAIRELKRQAGGLTRPVTVYLRGGTYHLSEPLVLTPQDSGTRECPITYAAYEDEKPVLSGGVPISEWQQTEVNGRSAWVAHLPQAERGAWYFRQLFANDERRPRTRLPREGFYRFAGLLQPLTVIPQNEGQDRVIFANDDLKQWRNLGDVEIVALHLWVESRLPIVAVDARTRIVTFTRPSVFRLTDDYTGAGARYYVENVLEALDTPGQWYLERSSGRLYYLPKPGEEPGQMRVIAPRLAQVVRFEGDLDNQRWVEHVHLRGIAFMHTEWDLPPDCAGFKQAAWGVPGAIYWQGARACALRECAVAHIGNYGVEVGAGCEENAIERNEIFDLGAGGIKINEGSNGTTVSDNHIHDGGYIFPSAIGVWVGNSGNNEIAHNLVHDFDYTGVSVGWRWGYMASAATNNRIEYNHIHDIGRGVLDDLGGIYTLGVSPGTVISHNFIHDCSSANYIARGIYLDEGSSNILVENNVVLRADDAAFAQHYGRDNQILNNIFAFGRKYQIIRSRSEPHRSFTFERNIVYFSEGDLLGGWWDDGNYAFDYNLYFDSSGYPVLFAGIPLKDWQALGQDVHSLIADPRFADPRSGDFTLAADSPAFALGFQRIDLSQVGPRAAVKRRSQDDQDG